MCVYLGSVRGGRIDEQFCGKKYSNRQARKEERQEQQGRESAKKQKTSWGRADVGVYCVFVVVDGSLLSVRRSRAVLLVFGYVCFISFCVPLCPTPVSRREVCGVGKEGVMRCGSGV